MVGSLHLDVRRGLNSDSNHCHDGSYQDTGARWRPCQLESIRERSWKHEQAIDIQYTLLMVRGRAQIKLRINPTTPKTIVHVPWSVMVLNCCVKVRIWLAIRKIRNKSWPTSSNSRPNRPIKSSPASAMLWIWGKRSLNCPITYPVYHAMPESPTMMITALIQSLVFLLLWVRRESLRNNS